MPRHIVAPSVLPEAFEAVWRQSRVAQGGGDGSVAKVMLDGSAVLAVIGQWTVPVMHITDPNPPQPSVMSPITASFHLIWAALVLFLCVSGSREELLMFFL